MQDRETAESPAPLFSVIVLNWNGRHLLGECLDSVLAQTFRDFELILVDNGSTDGSVEFTRERYGDGVRIVVLPGNRGYAEGNNEGFRAALGRYVVLLNNDTAVAPGWLAAISDAILRHPEAGMFTPKILNYTRRDEIDNTGHVIYRDGLARGQNRLEKDDGRFDEEGEALWPSGCAGVYKREMLDEIGLLDESFFAYGEDVDLGLRARWAGWECWYVPKAVLYHKYSATTGAFSPQKAFLVERNRLWVLFKNFPLRRIIVSPAWTAYRYLLHAIGMLSGRGSAAHLARDHSGIWLFSITLRAGLAALAGLPGVLRERARFRPLRKLTVREFNGLMDRFSIKAKEVAYKD